MNRLKMFVPLLVCLVLGSFFYLFLRMEKDPNAMPSALIGKSVPVFNLPALGESDDAAAGFLNETIFRAEPMLINIWATWCMPCRVEHPFLVQLAEQGIKIVGVNYKDEPGMAREWLTKRGNPYYLSVMDIHGRLGVDLGVFGAPETYLVDADGIIRFKHIGILDQRVWQRDFLPLWQQLQQ